MYRCLECGHIFEDGEQAKWSESRGEFWGSACSEEVDGCPLCKGDYEEVYNCEICGSVHTGDEIHGGVCDDCIDKYRHDIDMCFRIGGITKNEVKLNSFVTAVLNDYEIEHILLDAIKERNKIFPVDCMLFIEADKEEFGLELPRKGGE